MRSALGEKIPGAKHFRWHEVLFLPKWGVSVFPDDIQVEKNILLTVKKLELLRDLIERPLIITSMYRPLKYNELIGGAKKSAHIEGLACDFVVSGIKSSDLRLLIYPHMKDFNIRMEALDTVHVHIDLKCESDWDNKKRYFKP